jgi:hypothetical protein
MAARSVACAGIIPAIAITVATKAVRFILSSFDDKNASLICYIQQYTVNLLPAQCFRRRGRKREARTRKCGSPFRLAVVQVRGKILASMF